MASILVVVPASRERCGRLILLSRSGDRVSGPFRVLARASRRIGRKHENPSCARELPFGNPPTGSYAIIGSLPPNTAHRRLRRFGRLGALLLEPRAGEALSAFTRGRRVFALHGGPTDRAGRLYPTRGGLRLEDADLRALFHAVNASHERGDPVESFELVDATDDVAPPSNDVLPAKRRRRPERAPRGALGFTALLGGLSVSAGEGARAMDRRRFIATALLLVGGLSVAACDSPSPCDNDDDDDPSCTPPDGGGDGTGSDPGDYSSGGGSG